MELIPADYFRHLTPEEIFPDFTKPFEVDLGCGDGTFLMEMAAHYPERQFLGVERLLGRVQKIVRKSTRRQLTNLRVLRMESSYALGWLLPAASAQRIHLLFPDPWPKKRHAANRFVSVENIPLIHQALRPDGEFLFKTDHEPYYIEATEVLDASPLLERLPWIPDTEFYPQTDFEGHWLKAGKAIYSARYRKR
jgi:tRNA (guanine-N7-)-methyltransferase